MDGQQWADRAREWENRILEVDPLVKRQVLTEIVRAHFERVQPVQTCRVHWQKAPGPCTALPDSLRDRVIKELEHKDPRVRAEAALALMNWADEATQRALIRTMNDGDPKVRFCVVHALPVAVGRRCEGILSDRAADETEDEAVRAHALSGIEALTAAPGPLSLQDVNSRSRGGPIRTRGKTGGADLDKIAERTSSPYLAALARRASAALKKNTL